MGILLVMAQPNSTNMRPKRTENDVISYKYSLHHSDYQTFTTLLPSARHCGPNWLLSAWKLELRVSLNYLFVIIKVCPGVKHIQQFYHSKVDQCFTFGCIKVINCFFGKPYVFRECLDAFRLDKSWKTDKIRIVSPFVNLFPLLDLDDSLLLHTFGLIICDQFGYNTISQQRPGKQV